MITEIHYTVGRQGRITPIATIEPVIINHKKITKLSLGSIKQVMEKDIAISDLVNIEFKGDAIAVLNTVLFRPLDRQRPIFPDEAIFNHRSCLSASSACNDQFVARLQHMTSPKGLNLPMLTKPVLIKLINLGAIQTLIDLQQQRALHYKQSDSMLQT